MYCVLCVSKRCCMIYDIILFHHCFFCDMRHVLFELKELFAVHLFYSFVFFLNLHCHASMTHVAYENFKSNFISFIFRAEFAFSAFHQTYCESIVNGYCSKEANLITLNYLQAVCSEYCRDVMFSASVRVTVDIFVKKKISLTVTK